MNNTLVSDRVMALAGLTQAATLVSQLAQQGTADSLAMQGTVHSILMLDSPDSESIFINRHHLQLGLHAICDIYNSKNDTLATETMRYCVSMLHLQNQLSKNIGMLNTLRDRLEQIRRQIDIHGDEMASQVFSSFAGVYSDTLSTFPFRIQVKGKEELLKRESITNQIRAALLGGVRAATLWRQLGGSRWDFVFRRNTIYKTATNLLEA